jgi:copper(I)-binding protein
MPLALRPATVVTALLLATTAHAHDYRTGDVRIEHPYSLPSPAGAPEARAFVATLNNRGAQPDRLLRAATPLAQRVELRGADGAPLAAIELPPNAPLKMRPGRGPTLVLVGPGQALKVGDSVPLTLHFERGGTAEVRVEVQQPTARAEESARR